MASTPAKKLFSDQEANAICTNAMLIYANAVIVQKQIEADPGLDITTLKSLTMPPEVASFYAKLIGEAVGPLTGSQLKVGTWPRGKASSVYTLFSDKSVKFPGLDEVTPALDAIDPASLFGAHALLTAEKIKPALLKPFDPQWIAKGDAPDVGDEGISA